MPSFKLNFFGTLVWRGYLWYLCWHFLCGQNCLSWSFSVAQSSPEKSQLCYLSLRSYTWQLLTPGWVNIPGLTSVFISVKSELLRNEDETPAHSALTLCPGFDSSWWKFSACTPVASPVFMMAAWIHRALSGSSLAGCDSSKKAVALFKSGEWAPLSDLSVCDQGEVSVLTFIDLPGCLVLLGYAGDWWLQSW